MMKRSLPSWMSKTPKHIELPRLSLPNSCRVIYSHDSKDCSILCSEIMREKPEVVGFDMEWLPARKVMPQNKTAVIQICTKPNWDCYIFHISKMRLLPSTLQQIIEDVNIIKTGIGIDQDMWKLHADYDTNRASTLFSLVDLNKFAQSLNIYPDQGSKWSLSALALHLFKKTLVKDKVQMSNWEQFPLTEEQINYAALDAYVGLLIYDELQLKKKTRTKS